MRRILWISLPLYLLDQITKYLVLWNLPLHDSREIVPGLFNLVHYTNTGAAFGIMRDSNLFFMVLSVVALGVLAFFYKRGQFHDHLSQVGLGLLVSGILGNLTDRLLHRHVIDFLDFYWRDHHWPAFNVADSCICVAAALFVLSSFLEPARKP